METATEKLLTFNKILAKYNIQKASQLANTLVTLEDSTYYGRNEKSIKSLLSQISTARRPLSQELETAIVLAVKHINEGFFIDEFMLKTDLRRALRQSFESKNEANVTQVGKNPEEVYKSIHAEYYNLLINALITAKKITIITPDPMELKDRAESLRIRKVLVSKLQKNYTCQTEAEKVRYTFIFPKIGNSNVLAMQFWQTLLFYGNNLGMDMETILKHNNEGDNAYIKVFIVQDQYGVDQGRIITEDERFNRVGFSYNYGWDPHAKAVDKLNLMLLGWESIKRVSKYAHFLTQKLEKAKRIEYKFTEALLSIQNMSFIPRDALSIEDYSEAI